MNKSQIQCNVYMLSDDEQNLYSMQCLSQFYSSLHLHPPTSTKPLTSPHLIVIVLCSDTILFLLLLGVRSYTVVVLFCFSGRECCPLLQLLSTAKELSRQGNHNNNGFYAKRHHPFGLIIHFYFISSGRSSARLFHHFPLSQIPLGLRSCRLCFEMATQSDEAADFVQCVRVYRSAFQYRSVSPHFIA